MAARFQVVGGYSPSEIHQEMVASSYTSAMAGRAIVYWHGAGLVAPLDGGDARTDLTRYADRGHVVSVPTAGGLTTWANPASAGSTVAVDGGLVTGAIDNLLTYLAATYGANVSRVWFLADSHGAPGVLNWAVRNPTRFGAAVLRVPAIALQRIHDTNVAGLAAGMETAYGSLAALQAAYPTRDPLHVSWQARFATLALKQQVRLMYNPADPIVNRVDVEEFARNTGCELVTMLGPSHAPWGYFNIDEQLAWLQVHG